MFKHILLAYDGTAESVMALREGALLAKSCGAKVFLLSVIPLTSGVQMAEGMFGGVVGHQIDSYKELLEHAVARLKLLGFQPAARLVRGEPAPIIGAVAKEIGADLVVVGHRQQTLLSRWWSGSTHAYLSDYIRCSLLIARNPMSDEAFETELRKGQTGADGNMALGEI
jgi:nucleotide-binding universal stress UspA family protein